MTDCNGIVECSGGGTTPCSISPGRTKSYHTRESRSVAALFAAYVLSRFREPREDVAALIARAADEAESLVEKIADRTDA